MRIKILCGLAVLATTLFVGNVQAQIKSPQPSPTSTIKTTVGLTDVEVVYARPGAKGREVFGDLAPYGKIWRTGANASTKISFSDEVQLAGKKVPAGQYALYTIPGKDEWTVIIHKNTKHWGVGDYKEAEDQARFKVKAKTAKDYVETFTIDFSHYKQASAHLNLMWANTVVAIPVTAEIDSKMEAQIKASITDATAKVSARDYASAAGYYLESGKDLNKALGWMDKALEERPEAFWYMHMKAKILGKLGKTKEAIKVAEMSKEKAKSNPQGDFGYVKNNDNLIAELKAKK